MDNVTIAIITCAVIFLPPMVVISRYYCLTANTSAPLPKSPSQTNLAELVVPEDSDPV